MPYHVAGESDVDGMRPHLQRHRQDTADVLQDVWAVSSPYLRSRPYSCVRVIPNLRAAFDLFQSVSWSACSMARRSTSGRLRRRRGATKLGGPKRQMLDRDEPALTQDCRTLECIVQFANVARPLVAHQHLQRVWRQASRRASRRSAEVLQECVGQREDVATALAQRRNVDIEHTEPVKQVLSKASFRDGPLEIAVARGNHADVGLDEPCAAEALKFPFLQDPKQLRLGRRSSFRSLRRGTERLSTPSQYGRPSPDGPP